MKILDITSKYPWPLVDGARIVMYQAVRALADLGHRVHLVAVDDVDPGRTPLERLAMVHRFRHRRVPMPLGVAASMATPNPYTQWKRDRREVYDFLDRLHSRERFDLVYVDEIHVAQYGSYMKQKHGLPFVFRSHNVEYEIYGRYRDTVKNPVKRLVLADQTRRWRRFECRELAIADHIVAITERDAAAIRADVPGAKVSTIPAAVDLERFSYVENLREPASVVLSGHLGWAPNLDAAAWFADVILPIVRRDVPGLVTYLIGADPPEDGLPKNDPLFHIEGRVPEILPYYRRATLGIVPLRVGGGMRVKILEMMASGLPVISTAQGAEGNPAVPGEHYVAADTAEQFAAGIVRLVNDESERRRIAAAAHRFVESEFSIDVVGRRLESVLRRYSADEHAEVGRS